MANIKSYNNESDLQDTPPPIGVTSVLGDFGGGVTSYGGGTTYITNYQPNMHPSAGAPTGANTPAIAPEPAATSITLPTAPVGLIAQDAPTIQLTAPNPPEAVPLGLTPQTGPIVHPDTGLPSNYVAPTPAPAAATSAAAAPAPAPAPVTPTAAPAQAQPTAPAASIPSNWSPAFQQMIAREYDLGIRSFGQFSFTAAQRALIGPVPFNPAN